MPHGGWVRHRAVSARRPFHRRVESARPPRERLCTGHVERRRARLAGALGRAGDRGGNIGSSVSAERAQEPDIGPRDLQGDRE